jgi:hypothetical protein
MCRIPFYDSYKELEKPRHYCWDESELPASDKAGYYRVWHLWHASLGRTDKPTVQGPPNYAVEHWCWAAPREETGERTVCAWWDRQRKWLCTEFPKPPPKIAGPPWSGPATSVPCADWKKGEIHFNRGPRCGHQAHLAFILLLAYWVALLPARCGRRRRTG